jgi:DNA-binding MarR family transcriptional regulator
MRQSHPLSLADRPGYLLKRAHQAFCTAADLALRPHGITPAQYAALTMLEQAERLSGAELARRCFVTPQTMNKIIVGLERAGLIARHPHATHGRVLEASLTPAGRKILNACHGTARAVEAQMCGGIDQPEREELMTVLRRCVENLEGGTLA